MNSDINEKEKERVKKIMSNVFKNSIILGSSSEGGVLNIWDKMKSEYENMKNSFKYNAIDFKPEVNLGEYGLKLNIFAASFTLNNTNEEKAFYKKISNLLYFSYRTNFLPIRNNKNSSMSSYTSDCGWGCMIRASQMLLSRGIYKLIKRKYLMQNDYALYNTLLYFLDYPLKGKFIPKSYSTIQAKYITDNNIKEDNPSMVIQPPFSLTTVCCIGELYDKKAGDWFSDYHMPQIFNLINREYNAIDSLTILPFQSLIDKSVVITECFRQIEEDDVHNYNDTIQYDNKYYTFNKAGMIFISTRLGLDKISSEYYQSIKAIFQCKQFMGFIGGEGVMAFYFFGYNDSHLFYLDPHFNQEASASITTDLINSYLPRKLYQLDWAKLQTCLTFGFLFRDINEYKALFTWLSNDYKTIDNPCFSTVDRVDYNKYAYDDDTINVDKDDF